MRKVQRLIQQVARHEQTNVLILGESGTGKELVARGIHNRSSRNDEAFVPVNCGAIPGELLESELFGHEKGAFTGALSRRTGRFELADGGTLFLDEIGDMPFQMQVKLLRVLQERVFERVGGIESIPCDLRIVAATHRDIEQLTQDGKFREDLFYRLNVFPIQIPPLRERAEDLLLLLEHFSQQFSDPEDGPVRFTDSALEIVLAYRWPGNVRELANFIERMSILHAGDRIDVDNLPARYRTNSPKAAAHPGTTLDGTQAGSESSSHAEERPAPVAKADRAGLTNGQGRTPDDPSERAFEERQALARAFDEASPHELPEDGLDLRQHLAEIESELIRQALIQANQNAAAAARLLNLRRTTLVEKIRKYELG